MKKKIFTFLLVFGVLILQCACKDTRVIKPDDNTLVIEVSSKDFDVTDKTLKDYMDYLAKEGQLTFALSSGMINEINGKSNTSNSFWMLYTSDAENSNTAWGVIEYNNCQYGSAIYGAEQLKIKEGCLYIWAYQTF